MHKESWSVLAPARRTSVHPRCASTATTDMLRTLARLTGTTGLVTSPADFLSGLARGSTASTADQAFTVVPVFMGARDTDLAMLAADLPTSAADPLVVASAVAMQAVVAMEVTSMAGGASMAEAVPTVAGADKFYSLADSKRGPHSRYLKIQNGRQHESPAVSFSELNVCPGVS
jgi:hypothetical protein